MSELKLITYQDYKNIEYGDVIFYGVNLNKLDDPTFERRKLSLTIYKAIDKVTIRRVGGINYGDFNASSGKNCVYDITLGNAPYPFYYLSEENSHFYKSNTAIYIDKSKSYKFLDVDFNYNGHFKLEQSALKDPLSDKVRDLIEHDLYFKFVKNSAETFTTKSLGSIRTRARKLLVDKGLKTIYPDISMNVSNGKVEYTLSFKEKLPKAKPETPPKFNRLANLKIK